MNSTRQLLGRWHTAVAPGAARPQQARVVARPALETQRLPMGLPSIATIAQNLDVDENVPMQGLRDVQAVSYVSRRRMDSADFDADEVDEDGLPLVYNEQRIASFWKGRPGELASRWARFGAVAAPWLTGLINAVLTGQLQARQVDLARTAVDNLQQLGPTYIKLGQIMSIRPDVLPPPVMKELAKLQDKIAPFSTVEARAMIEKELGQPISVLFSEFSERPIAAASLAQVYRARLRSTGQEVAVKVQRPGALATVSKDLYVMRRAVGVYEALVRRFTAQTTDYQRLVSTFAEGLYTELDFRNEALNGLRMQELLDAAEFAAADIIIPKPLLELTTRRVLTMEWISGVKLTTLPPEEIRSLVKIGQAAFLTQLLEIGFFHGDPHPGNLLKVTEGPHAGKLALLDFGLVAEIPAEDREAMVSATIHLANRDWDALMDDFIALGFLPVGADKGKIIPVMDRVLTPYLRGGGAKSFNFQALSQDLLTATLEIPFSVPPYMSLLARSVATLEGIALMGDPEYQMVTQAYPFVVRKVLRNDSSGAAQLLRDIVFDADGNVKPTRLGALLNAALGYAADNASGFVDLDALPEDGASVAEIASFLLSEEARDLRPVLVTWVSGAADLVFRDRVRKALALLPSLAPRIPLLGIPLPGPPPPPVFLPGLGFMSIEQAGDLLAPPLSQEENIYLVSLVELFSGLLGVPAKELEAAGPGTIFRLLTNPSEQMRELQQALATMTGSSANSSAVRALAVEVVEQLMQTQAARAGVPVETLFPVRPNQLVSLMPAGMGLAGEAAMTRSSTVPAASSAAASGVYQAPASIDMRNSVSTSGRGMPATTAPSVATGSSLYANGSTVRGFASGSTDAATNTASSTASSAGTSRRAGTSNSGYGAGTSNSPAVAAVVRGKSIAMRPLQRSSAQYSSSSSSWQADDAVASPGAVGQLEAEGVAVVEAEVVEPEPVLVGARR